VLVLGHAEDATDPLAGRGLGDPGRLALRVGRRRVVGDDAGDERLEAGVPAELGRVHLAVGPDHPAQVAGPAKVPDRRGHRHLPSY
jgi:hypothetical protein